MSEQLQPTARAGPKWDNCLAAITGTLAADGYTNMPFSLPFETGNTARISVIKTLPFKGELRVGSVFTPVISPTEQETV